MKPPAFQFYADDFLSGTADMTAEEVGVYIRLLCHAWSKDGLNDEDSRLMLMAGQCQASSLAHAKSKFKMEGGRLRNHRQEMERKKQSEYRTRQAEHGKKRWVGKADPDADPDAKSKPPSPSPSPSSLEEGERGLPEIPPMSRKDFDVLAEMRLVPKECADWFWNTHDARNWVDATGRQVMKVEPLLLNAMVKWRAKHPVAANGANGSNGELSGVDKMNRSKELEHHKDQARRIREAYESHQDMTPADKERLKKIKDRIKELEEILGFKKL